MAERASKTFWQLLLFFSPMLFGDFLRIAVDLKAAWALDLVCRYEEAIGLGNIFLQPELKPILSNQCGFESSQLISIVCLKIKIILEIVCCTTFMLAKHFDKSVRKEAIESIQSRGSLVKYTKDVGPTILGIVFFALLHKFYFMNGLDFLSLGVGLINQDFYVFVIGLATLVIAGYITGVCIYITHRTNADSI